MKKIDKSIIIAELIKLDAGVVPVLTEVGMHCLGCPAAQGETLGEACEAHGINVDELIAKINAVLEG